jgi:hypothetical protein
MEKWTQRQMDKVSPAGVGGIIKNVFEDLIYEDLI